MYTYGNVSIRISERNLIVPVQNGKRENWGALIDPPIPCRSNRTYTVLHVLQGRRIELFLFFFTDGNFVPNHFRKLSTRLSVSSSIVTLLEMK